MTYGKQHASASGSKSDLLQINCGSQQGFMLGSLLFLIPITELPNAPKKVKFHPLGEIKANLR